MQSLQLDDVLRAWEAGVGASPSRRALLLLAARKSESQADLARMPVGQIAARVLELRSELLGPTLTCLSDCTECGTTVESDIDVASLLSDAKVDQTATTFDLTVGDEQFKCRLPTAQDLAELKGPSQCAATSVMASLLRPLPADAAEVRVALERAVLERDPLAHIELEMSCPQCGYQWSQALPVFEFVWSEIGAFARGIFNEVAQLASAFGWREADILAMSAQRRRRYLEMLSS